MKALMKPAIVLGMTGALALASATPSQAHFRPWAAAAGIGLAVGAIAASAAAANNYAYGGYYGPEYAYEPYYASPGYVYVAPGYSAYAAAPAYGYYRYGGRHWDPHYGYNSNTVSSFQERRLQGHDY